MTYTEGALFPDESFPPNLSAHHRRELEKARAYLDSVARKHPGWIVRRTRG